MGEGRDPFIFWYCASFLLKDMAMAIHLSTEYGCFYSTTAELSIVTKNIRPMKPEKLSSVLLWKKLAEP